MSTKRKTTVVAEPSPKPKRRQPTTAVAKKRVRDKAVVDLDDEDSAGLSDATPKKASQRKKRISKINVDSDGDDSAGLSDATPKKINKRTKDASVFVKELSRTPVLQIKNTPAKVNFSYADNESKEVESYAIPAAKTPAGSSKKSRAQTVGTPVSTYPSGANTPVASAPPSTAKKSRSAAKPAAAPSPDSSPVPQFVPRSSGKTSKPAVTPLPKCHLPSTTSAVPKKAPFSDPTDQLQDEREILAIWGQIYSALSVCVLYVMPSVVVALAFACLQLGLSVPIAVATVAIVYSVLVGSALLPFFFIIVPFILFSRLMSDLASGGDHLLSEHVKRHTNFYCRLAALGVIALGVYNSFREKKACCAH